MKRMIDLIGASIGLAIFTLPMLVIALAVWLNLGRPIFFIHERPGLHGVPFRMIKFRTMREAYDEHGEPLPDELRLTRFGRFLRATSLDELPELINVLKGEMSLVGPRPHLMEYLPLYTPEQARRHDVLPGITGWAQIHGRQAIDYEEKFRLDVWYVDNWSLWLDFKILFLTVVNVLRAEGVNREGYATGPKFTGSHQATAE